MFVPFSCHQRCSCPSCHQKRSLLMSLHLTDDVLINVPHRQFVSTIPKRMLIKMIFEADPLIFPKVWRRHIEATVSKSSLKQKRLNKHCPKKFTITVILRTQRFSCSAYAASTNLNESASGTTKRSMDFGIR